MRSGWFRAANCWPHSRHRLVSSSTLCPTFGWTHVVSTTGGKTIPISGQVGINERVEVVGRGDLKAQTEQAFHNISLALAAVGATFRDVVKTGLFVVGLKPEHVPIIREVRSRFVSAEHPPASTLVSVSALVGPDWLIEIEAVAILDE
ncbi:MAG: RidA family protein [Planctomycetota bacterium]